MTHNATSSRTPAEQGWRTEAEIGSQPDCWRRAAAMLPEVAEVLPAPGERVAGVGCGTSLFIAQSYAVARESAGHGETDAFAASEMPVGRRYDRVIALTRSGTTTEILRLLCALGGYPTTEQGLEALLKQPAGASGWAGPSVKGGQGPQDPWGRPVQSRAPRQRPGHAYDLFSLGSDGAPGGTGEAADIYNK